ncbi:hypothetical protein [Dyella mobilis]|uniref:Uncharacterized protein n=1 Tax=Dyella mobilis TaxID=1849582 RepID=A0ABS2KHL1_9GAMM|nr:hypothetical protein [Dyella mobilis]MBM7130650.1 hypothetical protein [Dyella mobilis]
MPRFWFGRRRADFLSWLHVFSFEVVGVLDSIEIKFRNDEDTLREIIAICHRYNISMEDLASLENEGNSQWFNCEGKFWYEKVFGKA